MNRFKPLRMIPPGSMETRVDGIDAVVYLYGGGDTRPCAVGYKGKAQRPAFHHIFRDESGRADFLKRWFESLAQWAKYKAEQKAARDAKREAGHPYNVGDVLFRSWGYDQTNVDFYEVVEVKSKQSAMLRKIGADSIDTGFMCGNCTARKGSFSGEAFRSMWTGSSLSAKGDSLSAWDGRPLHWSNYA